VLLKSLSALDFVAFVSVPWYTVFRKLIAVKRLATVTAVVFFFAYFYQLKMVPTGKMFLPISFFSISLLLIKN